VDDAAKSEQVTQECIPKSTASLDAGGIFQESGLFRTLLDSLHEGVYFVDPERCIQYWNHGAEEITGYAAEEVVGRSCADNILVHVSEEGQSLCLNGCPLQACISDGEDRNNRVFLHHKEGHRVPVQVTASAIRGDDGHIIGGLETFFDASSTIAALDEIDRLKELSLLCPLTGVGNRRYTEETLSHRIDEMKRQKSRLAVLFFDIDHFKAFNDTYGHAVGDVVLKMTARTLAGAMRSYDFLGRWGGEEFVAILSNMTPIEVESMAERLRMLVENSSRTLSENRLKVTVSIGAYVCSPEDTGESAIATADGLMYESKSKGRNRVTMNQTVRATRGQ
jgi:diguanylate cyclase (GGDEF)-like protein/PAS domain S-box-containing protein